MTHSILDLLVHRLPLIDGERSFLVDNLRNQSLEHWFYDVGQRYLSELGDLVDALEYGQPKRAVRVDEPSDFRRQLFDALRARQMEYQLQFLSELHFRVIC